MRTALSRLELLRPRSLRDALAMLRDEGPLVPLAGATDLYVALNAGALPATRFLDLWRLGPLRRIAVRGDRLSIGALASYAALLRSRAVRSWLPMLAAAAAEVGGAQIRSRGTIGGNVGTASPAGDTLPVLAAADADVVLRSAGGERRVPVRSFVTGYRSTARAQGELIVALEVPRLEGAQWFRKVGTRAGQAVSKVVVAGVRAPAPRLAFGSVAPTVVRIERTEAALASGAPLEDAVRLLAEEIAPVDDHRSSARYRREVAKNLLRRFWADTDPGRAPCG
jgi:CO/xanthine dehydrogenase FAD-binding subunit